MSWLRVKCLNSLTNLSFTFSSSPYGALTNTSLKERSSSSNLATAHAAMSYPLTWKSSLWPQALTGADWKETWMKLTGPMTFYSGFAQFCTCCTIFFTLRKLTFSLLYIDKKCMYPYFKSLIPEFLTFCYLLMIIVFHFWFPVDPLSWLSGKKDKYCWLQLHLLSVFPVYQINGTCTSDMCKLRPLY